jgi:hypothetical protein
VKKNDQDAQNVYSAAYQLLKSKFLSRKTKEAAKSVMVKIDEEMTAGSDQPDDKSDLAAD